MALYPQDAGSKERMDIIYFKNGKKIEGVVVKQQFGTISIKVREGQPPKDNIKIYQQSDILKIEKGKESEKKNMTDSLRITIEGGDKNRAVQKQAQSGDVKPIVSDYTPELIPEQVRQNPLPTPAQQEVVFPAMIDQPVMIDGSRSSNPDDYFDPFSVPVPKRREKLWNREIRGFRGFLDYAYIQGIGNHKNNRMETATSIGFQFNPIFYTGIGTSFNLTLNDKDSSLPVFINPRINFLDDNITPFWDVKVGYSVAEGKGLYWSTSLGCSFTKEGRRAFNLGLVYSFQRSKYYEWDKSEENLRVPVKVIYHGLALKLSYEFGIGR